MQPPYDQLKGVVQTVVGYTGGKMPNPTYEAVCEGNTGHTEAILVTFDPSIVTYEQVLDVFWRNVDPTTRNRQFCDVGTQYRTGIYYYGEAQKKIAERTKEDFDKSGKYGKKIMTEILQATIFYPAEEYHQKYYVKNPARYKAYHDNCGREQYLEMIWGNPNTKSSK